MMFKGLLASAFLAIGTVSALSAPSASLNKTVTVSFTVSGLAQQAGEATPHSFSSVIGDVIYISSAGRLFVRHTAFNRKGSKRSESAPNEGGSGGFAFQGNRIVGVRGFSSGARRVIVDFDSSFTSCTASVIEGNEGGVINRIGASGKRVTETQVTSSSPSCSIQSGNGFSG